MNKPPFETSAQAGGAAEIPFYSQFGEDAILADIYRGQSKGICVEVGAYDGVALSNTYHFEQKGWTCVLVEPNPDACARIRKNRNARLFECAAAKDSGSMVLHAVTGAPLAEALSAVDPDEAHLRRIVREGGTVRTVMIPCRKLDDILSEAGIERIDFMTIDVEGHELDVLSGFDLERFVPRIIILEDNDLYGPTVLPDYMARHGYGLFERTCCNHWFVRKNDPLLTLGKRLKFGFLLAARGCAPGRGAIALLRAAKHAFSAKTP